MVASRPAGVRDRRSVGGRKVRGHAQACDCLRSRGRTCCDEDVPEATDEALLILLSNLAARLAEEGYDALAKVIREGQAPDALGQALRDVLRNPVLVVWDEFQRVLDKDGLPPPAFRSLLDAIARRRDRPGRLLVLSSQRVQRAKWSESLQFETLGPLDPSAARGFFDELLQQRGRLDEVPEPRRDELIDWVEGHPRVADDRCGARGNLGGGRHQDPPRPLGDP